MSEDAVAQPLGRRPENTALARAQAFAARHQTLALSVALFVVAFAGYLFFLPGLFWVTAKLTGEPASFRWDNPVGAPYKNFVLLADAFLHGHVDVNVPQYIEWTEHAGKRYIIPPPWPALVILPGVIVFGAAMKQTLASAVLGAINAPVVAGVVRGGRKFWDHLWVTALFVFGTVYFYAVNHGGVWYFSHTVAVLFLFFAIYATLVRPSPLIAGLCLGAAFWSRQPTILATPFFVIMFSNLWLPTESRSEFGRWLLQPDVRHPGEWLRQGTQVIPAAARDVRLQPLLEFAAGLGVFIVLSGIYNYMRFATPLDASQNDLPANVRAEAIFSHGPFSFTYYPRHILIAFEKMPIFQKTPPYVMPSISGMAIWATTPALFYAFFAGIKDRRVIAVQIALIVATAGVILVTALSRGFDLGLPSLELPHYAHLYGFVALVVIAIVAGRRDRLVLACWAAILPIALMLFTFAGSGFAQFSYRFSLDFMPFLFLLAIRGMGGELRWHAKLLILASVLINVWGALWVFQFDTAGFLGYHWTGW